MSSVPIDDGPSRPVLKPEWLPRNFTFSPASATDRRVWSYALYQRNEPRLVRMGI